tara:strand:+ start:808 stop:1044 length:237 start_codon:yes stop_codon:yes gene_type:complete
MKVVYILYYGTNMEFISGNIKAVHDKMYSLTPPDKLIHVKNYFWVVRKLKQVKSIIIAMPFMFDFTITKIKVQSKFIN